MGRPALGTTTKEALVVQAIARTGAQPQPKHSNNFGEAKVAVGSQAKALTGVTQQLPTRCRGVYRLVGADFEFSQQAMVSPETSWDGQ